ncbi:MULTISPECIES: hypothetical protein [Haloglomus]|uniref:hypothetical protein n=1 Tax=Haloglomus TaxID=2806252 RepID=UPI0020CA229F|nr:MULTISPECIES: hypothetical protein [Haloglomus]
MPSEFQSASAEAGVPAWRQAIAAEIGEDPGRWLDRDLVERAPGHTDRTMQRAVHARIQGIRSREVIDAWQTVEVRLERGPRQQVMAWLNQRDQQLKAREEPSQRAVSRPTPTAEPEADDGPELVHDDCGSVVEERDGEGYRCPDCDTITRSVAELSAVSNATPVAADGGEP